MKKYAILVLVLVLTAALFTGCGCTNQDPSRNTTVPTTTPTAATTETTRATTAPTTMPSVEPSTNATMTTATALWTEWTTSRKTPPPVRVQLVSDNTPGQFAPVHIIPCVAALPSAPAPADEVHGFWESRQCCMGNPRPGTAS